MLQIRFNLFLLILLVIGLNNMIFAQENSNWNVDIGISGFKSSVNNQPNELLYNPVFSRWENINQNTIDYKVSEYQRLEPLSFNMNMGIDVFIHYRKYLMIKIGYDYSNPIGIGGTGNISYEELSTGNQIAEYKEFSYTSHQINYYIGPVIPVNDGQAEIYMGFSIMSPTWVNYKEKYSRIVNDQKVVDYDKKFTGFFGNCRTVLGIQVLVTDNLKLGSEIVYSYFNGLELKSGDIKDNGFKFPSMKWNFTLRYALQ